jgi:hypothetical protein
MVSEVRNLRLKFFDRMYRIPRLITRIFVSSFQNPSSRNSSAKIAFFSSGMHFQEMSEDGLILAKAEYWISVLERSGIGTQTVLNPFSVEPSAKTSRHLHSIEYLSLNSLKRYLLVNDFKWVIDQCDTENKISRSLKNKICTQIYYDYLRESNFKVIAGIALPPELCVVASHLDLPTYEFQHGSSLTDELDSIGRYLTAPKFLFVWDSHYSKGRPNEKSLIHIGYPKRFQQRTDLSNQLAGTSRLKILVSMSYGELESADPSGFLNEVLYRSIHAVLDDGHEVYLRFHPAVFTGLEISLNDSKLIRDFLRWKQDQICLQNVNIDQRSNLFESLANVDLHFTFASSTVIEAAYSGVASFLFCNVASAPNLPAALFESGIVQFACESSVISQIRASAKPISFQNSMDEELFLKKMFNHF